MLAKYKLSRLKYVEIKWVQELMILVTFFILVTLNGWRGITNPTVFVQSSVYFAILYVHAQVQRSILIPVFFKKRKPYINLIYCVILLLAFSAMLYMAGIYWIYDFINPHDIKSPELYIFHVGTCSLSLVGFMGIFIMIQSYDNQKKEAVNTISKNETELSVLHSQLNPHFLFNTFNNLYAISLNEPERMPDFILQVTKLMRYHLQSYSLQETDLADELSFIESYISLEEERFGQRCKITYRYKNETSDEQYKIAPLVMITFIENAFKHGTGSIEQSFVDVYICISNATLELKVVNSVPAKKIANMSNTQIGQSNTIRRLNLLYGNTYKLTILPREDKYYVHLILPLTVLKDGEQV